MSGERAVPLWREPTRAQWACFLAAWFGWVLDAFDFTVFLLVMPAIAKEYWAPYEGAGLRFIRAIALAPEAASRTLKREVGEVKVMRAQITKYFRAMHAQLSQIINLPKGGQ